MAQEEIIFRLKVDAGDSASKVNSVDKEFDSLRSSIKDTENEVEKLSKQFGDNSKEADTARKKLAQLNSAYEDLSKAATDVNAKFEEVYGELQPLTTRLGEAEDRLYELALAGKQNTKEYQDLLETVARYRQTQIETDRVVDNAAQTFSQKLGSAIQGAAAGFQLVQGAAALFGEENEELEKTLLKVQSAMALAQGIEGVRQALPLFTNFGNAIKTQVVTAFTSLKGAIMATGIGALIVTVGVMINEWMEYSKSVEDAENAQQKLNEENKESLDLINDIADASEKKRNREKGGLNQLKNEIDLMKAKGATEKDIFNKSKQIIDEEIKNLKIRGFSYDQSNEKERLAAWETKDQIDKLKNEKLVIEAEYNRKIKEETQKANEEAIRKRDERKVKNKQIAEQEAQEQLALRRKISDLLIANIKDDDERERATLLEKQKREREDLKKQYEDKKKYAQLEKELKIQQGIERKALEKKQGEESRQTLLENQNKVLDDQKAILEAEIITNAENFALKQQRQLELENTDYEQKKLNAKDNKAQLELIEAQHTSNIKAINKEATDYQKMLDEELKNAKMSLVEQTSNMFGELANSAKEGSAIQKAFAVTQLTIDTAKAISSTIAGATAAAAAGGPAAPFLIGGYIASGIATVTKAMSTAKKLLNAPLPSVQPPSANRPTDNAQGTTQQGTTQTIQAQSTYKVVVVDSDITKMQDKTKKVNAISTI